MIPKDGMSFEYLKGALRRRVWYVVLPLFAICTTTIVYCIKVPRLYKSSTLILVQPQEVPSDYVRSTVTTDARARLNTLKQQVMSRPRLEGIIKEYNLYPNVRAKATMYDAVETMRKHIYVEVSETDDRRDTAPAAFEVSFEGPEPIKVRNVTAAIANLFIEDHLRLRERQAAGTSAFLERELERMREELRKKEELVRQFKEENLGLLPEQMENNYRILAQLQQHLDSLNDTIQKTEDRKVLLQAQLGRLESLQAETAQAAPQAPSTVDQVRLTLPELRQQLENLKSRYSDKHPDVVRLAATIAKREKQQTLPVSATDPESATPPAYTEAERLMHVQREDLLTQIRLINKEIAALQEDKRNAKREIDTYRLRIENGPRIEQQFVDLRRDYNEASENYQSLLQKKLQAALAENLERTQKGEQFRILEPANLPQKPFKPNIARILPLGFILALAFGLGLAYVREYVDPTFWSSKNLEAMTQVPVLVSVPVVHTANERRLNLLKRAGTVVALFSMGFVLVYALFVLWKMDPGAFPIPVG